MKNFILSFLLLFPCFLFAQNYEWARGMGSPMSDGGYALAIDASGNVYSTGTFQGTVDFDPGAGTVNLTAMGTSDGYIQKLDAAGNFVWVQQISSSIMVISEALALDASGNVHVTGAYSGTADLDPGTGIVSVASLGTDPNIFVLKLDPTGTLLWAKHTESVLTSVARSIAIDAAGNVYSTGNFEGTADFNPGATVSLTALNQRDTYIQKHDASGNLLWVKQLENTVVDEGKAIAVDAAGAVYVTGKFWGTTDFDPGLGTNNLTSNGADDTYILKLTTAGDLAWVKQIGGPDYEYGYAIQVDAAGNIYSAGSFQNTVDFDPGAGTTNLTSAGFDDSYLFKLNAAGDFLWAKQITGSGVNLILSMFIDATGSIYTTGIFENTADFDPGVGTFNLTAAGLIDIFIQKLDATGNLVWALAFGGSGQDFSQAISIGAVGEVYSTGIFSDTVDFDPGVGMTNQISVGSFDSYVLKLNDAHSTPIESPMPTASISLYPNPVRQRVAIRSQSAKIGILRVFNHLGQEVKSGVQVVQQSDSEMILDVSRLKPGIYVVSTAQGAIKMYKE